MNAIPFTYGKITESADFTNRTEELLLLKRNFIAGINTILISPRRWGKSSLVKKAAGEVFNEHKSIRVCHIDIFNIRSENEFYTALANEVLKMTASGWEEMAANAREFLSRLVPRIEFSPDMQTKLTFGVNLDETERQPDEILDLAEKIARNKNLQLIVCIDEFQSITRFAAPVDFQKKLRSHWQHHSHVAYCLYGSKRHMLLDIFSNISMPFYKFGDLFFLKKISREDWLSFIQKRYQDTNKIIPESSALLITELTDCHPFYVQQLSQQAWFRTESECTDEIVRKAHQALIEQLSLLFTGATESLSSAQLNLLKAIIQGEKQLSSQAVIKKYKLGTSANVVRQKRILIQEEILDEMNGELVFLDPIYQHWLKQSFDV